MKLDEAIKIAKEYYQNKTIPKTVTEYMGDYPSGLSRTSLKSKLGLTAGQFLEKIGSSYTKMESTGSKLSNLAKARGHRVLSDVSTITKSTKVSLICSEGHEFTTYWDSYVQCKTGCKSCSGNLELYSRVEDLENRAKLLNVSLVGKPTSGNQLNYLQLKCNICSEEYSCRIGRFLSPTSDKEGTCPNCRSSDTRVTYSGLTFGSQFERECFKLLEHKDPMLQVRYSDYFNTTRQWTCDFVIEDCWIEVSSFRKDSQGYDSYLKNINNKRDVVESGGKRFIYLTSLREVEDFIDKI